MSGRQGFIKSVFFVEINKRNAIMCRLINYCLDFFLVNPKHDTSHSLNHTESIFRYVCALFAPFFPLLLLCKMTARALLSADCGRF